MKKVCVICVSLVFIFALIVSSIIILVDRHNDMEKKTYIANAQKYFSWICEDPSSFAGFEFLRQYLEENNLSLDYVGISKLKLEELYSEGCRLNVEKYLSWIRKRPSEYSIWLSDIEEKLKKCNFSPDKIKEIKDELRLLAPKPKLNPMKMAQTPCLFLQQGVFLLSIYVI